MDTAITGGALAAVATASAASSQGSTGAVRSGGFGPVGGATGAGAGSRTAMGVRRRRLEVVIEPLDEDE